MRRFLVGLLLLTVVPVYADTLCLETTPQQQKVLERFAQENNIDVSVAGAQLLTGPLGSEAARQEQREQRQRAREYQKLSVQDRARVDALRRSLAPAR